MDSSHSTLSLVISECSKYGKCFPLYFYPLPAPNFYSVQKLLLQSEFKKVVFYRERLSIKKIIIISTKSALCSP